MYFVSKNKNKGKVILHVSVAERIASGSFFNSIIKNKMMLYVNPNIRVMVTTLRINVYVYLLLECTFKCKNCLKRILFQERFCSHIFTLVIFL